MNSSRNPGIGAANRLGRLALHFTPASNLESVAMHGLLPAVGPLSKLDGITSPVIHLYGSPNSVDESLLQWMGNLLGESTAEGQHETLLGTHAGLSKTRRTLATKHKRSAPASSHTCRSQQPIALLTVDVADEELEFVSSARRSRESALVCRSILPPGRLELVSAGYAIEGGATELETFLHQHFERRFWALALRNDTEASWREMGLLARHGLLLDAQDAIATKHGGRIVQLERQGQGTLFGCDSMSLC